MPLRKKAWICLPGFSLQLLNSRVHFGKKKGAGLNAWSVRCLGMLLSMGTEQKCPKVVFYPPSPKVVFYPPILPVESSLCVLLSILPESAILDRVPSKECGVKVSVVNYLP